MSAAVAALLRGVSWTASGWAGGSHYGITPGARPDLAGRISQWPAPTPRFARDSAPEPDGNICVAVMAGNRIARFEPRTQRFVQWTCPPGPVPTASWDPGGIVRYTGNGNGTIGRLDPATGHVWEYRAPSGGDPPTLVRS